MIQVILYGHHALSWIQTNKASIFSPLFGMCIFVFDGMRVYPIDWYQNAIPRAMPLQEFKRVQLQERFTLMSHDSIDHLKTLCMSILSLLCNSILLLSGRVECEWKRCSSLLSVEKTLSILSMNPALNHCTGLNRYGCRNSLLFLLDIFKWFDCFIFDRFKRAL